MNRSNIEKIAHTPEDRLLLAKVWDKIQSAIRQNIPGTTCFLSPRELEMTRYLFGDIEGLYRFGGYDEAERRMLVYLPEYLSEDYLQGDNSPMVCLRACFYESDALVHRHILGALMGCGIARESIGDILVGTGSCDFFVTAEIAPYVLQNLTSAGRTKLYLEQIPVSQVSVPQQKVQEIRDTLASLRLDSVISAGFRMGRSAAVQYIHAGKVSIDGLPCEKSDKQISEGSKISLRGFGKIKLHSINGQTKNGRISVTIHRYM